MTRVCGIRRGCLGSDVGVGVGFDDGADDRVCDGLSVDDLGIMVGGLDGLSDSTTVGLKEGTLDGLSAVGLKEGNTVDTTNVGADEGFAELTEVSITLIV
mmetsp:Transcript_25269/g.31138  ORF Transcript_25269/g.31138 Transcript_25269/m.31138 type:complete len:100 (-) Transcript_25269:407-706(-)